MRHPMTSAEKTLLKAVEAYFGTEVRKGRSGSTPAALAKTAYAVLAIQLLDASGARLDTLIRMDRRVSGALRRYPETLFLLTPHLEPIVRSLNGDVPYLGAQAQEWLKRWAREHQVALFPGNREVAHGR